MVTDQCGQELIQRFPIGKAQFHFCRMDIHVEQAAVNGNLQHGKRVFMLHHKGFVGFFNTFGNQAALDITPVDKIVLKIAVPPGNQGLANKSADRKTLIFALDLNEVRGNVAPIDMVNHLFKVGIAGSM